MNFFHALEIGASYLDDKQVDSAIEWFYYGIEYVKQLKSESADNYHEIQKYYEDVLQSAIDQVGITG